MRDTVLMHIHGRALGIAEVDVTIGEGSDAQTYWVAPDDQEPDDVWGPILSRALDDAMFEHYGVGNDTWRVDSWEDAKLPTRGELRVLLVTITDQED